MATTHIKEMSDEDRRAQAAALDAWMKEEGLSFDDMVDQQIRENAEELGSASWQIRVEALRAAVQFTSALASRLAPEELAGGRFDTLALAKRFERYLEGGD